MTPSVGPEADWELTEGAVFYAREANAEVGLAFTGIRKSIGAFVRSSTENALNRGLGGGADRIRTGVPLVSRDNGRFLQICYLRGGRPPK